MTVINRNLAFVYGKLEISITKGNIWIVHHSNDGPDVCFQWRISQITQQNRCMNALTL